MNWIIIKFGLSATILVAASELSKRFPKIGALLISLPLLSLLTMLWLYVDTQDKQQVATFSTPVFWFTLPSLPMFLLIPYLLNQGSSLAIAISGGIVLTVFLYGVAQYCLPALYT